MSDTPTWRLDDLYGGPDDPAIAVDLERLRSEARAFAQRYRDRVATLAPAELAGALVTLEDLYEALSRVRTFASLLFAANTLDARHQALLARVREAATDIQTELLFFDLELRRAPEEHAAALGAAPELAGYRHHLAVVRSFAPHTLSEPEERVIAQLRQTGSAAWSQLYTEVTSGLRFPVTLNGAAKELTDAEARALRSSPDRDVRRQGSDVLLSTYERHAHVLTFAFNTLVQDHRLTYGLRSYSDPLEPTALENEFTAAFIERLLSVTEQHYGLAADYYRLKARRLGLDGDFQSCDLLAPYEHEEQRFTWAEAQALVRDAYAAFHPALGALVQEFYDGRWIDTLPRHGKRGGAFCSGGTPRSHPYVLMNFTGRLEDVFTLAHELGHGVHYALARRQTPFNFEPTIPMAEVASTFGELLLAEHLRRQGVNGGLRERLLTMLIEDVIATVLRQAMYTRWEQRAHARRAAGLVTADEYGVLWQEALAHLYGDAVRFGALDRWGWITIPHFVHYRFYCFSYVFGHLLALALLQRAADEGPAFAQRYLALLAAGGSDRPEALLALVGVDPWAPGFWERGFATAAEWIAQFRAAVVMTT
ncbi:MAG: M3 family oligoendopeptidase [Chloroflexi bacterium]|nr:M3 family oligoendopeptidase [Chloroflexota bacterium]